MARIQIFQYRKKEDFTLINLFSGRLNNELKLSSIIGSGPFITNKLKQLSMPEQQGYLIGQKDRTSKKYFNI